MFKKPPRVWAVFWWLLGIKRQELERLYCKNYNNNSEKQNGFFLCKKRPDAQTYWLFS